MCSCCNAIYHSEPERLIVKVSEKKFIVRDSHCGILTGKRVKIPKSQLSVITFMS